MKGEARMSETIIKPNYRRRRIQIAVCSVGVAVAVARVVCCRDVHRRVDSSITFADKSPGERGGGGGRGRQQATMGRRNLFDKK